jgi:hypothetical protein
LGESAVTAEDLDKAKKDKRNIRIRKQQADLKANNPEGYKAKLNRKNQRRQHWRANMETEDGRMKRNQWQQNWRAHIAAHPIKGPEQRAKNAASYKRWLDKKKQRLASTPRLVTDTDPADSLITQVVVPRTAKEIRRMKRNQWQRNRRAFIATHPIKGPEQRAKNAASEKRRRDNKKQRLASTPPLVTDTDPADSSTQVAPHGACVTAWHPQVQHSDAHPSLQNALPYVAQLVEDGASSSVTQAAPMHSGATDFLSLDFDTLPHLTPDDIRLFTS